MKNFKIKTRIIKSLMEEEIPSGSMNDDLWTTSDNAQLMLVLS